MCVRSFPFERASSGGKERRIVDLFDWKRESHIFSLQPRMVRTDNTSCRIDRWVRTPHGVGRSVDLVGLGAMTEPLSQMRK